jgi:molybdopterin synthase catalytic subunit
VRQAIVLNRLGRVAVGEVSIFIGVSAGHRDEAYGASRFIIEAVKHRVPIWKKEIFADGSTAWTGACVSCV